MSSGMLGASVVTGQALSPAATAIQARQSQFREVGTAFKAINDELRKAAPGKFVLGSSARQIATNLRQVRTMFPAGSLAAPGQKSKALPEIWTTRAAFDKLNASAVAEADKLAMVLRSTDTGAIAKQVKVLGATCQSCHRQFRVKTDAALNPPMTERLALLR